EYAKGWERFLGVETPLFESMLVVRDVAEAEEAQVLAQGDDVQEPAAEEVVTDVVSPTPTSPSPPSPVIPSSPPYQPPCPPQPQDAEGASLLFQQVLDTCSALARRVEGLENDKATQQLEIVKLKARVQEAVEIVTTAKLMIEVVTTATTQAVAASTLIPAAKPKILNITAASVVSTRRRKGVVIRDPEEELSSDTPAETPKVKDKGKGILIKAPKPMKKKDQIELDVEKRLEIVQDEDDDVFVEATPLAQKVPVVDYHIVVIDNKPRAKDPISKGPPQGDCEETSDSHLPEKEIPHESQTPAQSPKGKGILIEAPKPMKKKDQIEMDAENARKLQEEINKEHEEAYKNIDWNAALNHVQSKEPQYIKRYHGMKKKSQTESEARKNMIFYLKNTEGYKMDFFKGKKEEMEKEDEEIIKSINETPAQKAAKKRKLSEEAQEADDLRKRFEIV
nr:hypothetical protein [Tanacetum cinerariifolium]